MKIPSIRPAQIKDINHLVDIDIKSYPYPWPLKKWRGFAIDIECEMIIALVKIEPVSVCVWKSKGKEAQILKLATKPAYRGQGAGTLLLDATKIAAVEKGLKAVSTIVPEINCFPGHPDDISQWLRDRGFNAVPPIFKDRFKMYGQMCDGFKFIFKIED